MNLLSPRNKLVVAVALALMIASTVYWITKRQSELGVPDAVIVGNFDAKSLVLVPRKVSTNYEAISRLSTLIDSAPRRLVMPTLGSLRGPLIFHYRGRDEYRALFYARDLSGFLIREASRRNGNLEIEMPIKLLEWSIRVSPDAVFGAVSNSLSVIDDSKALP